MDDMITPAQAPTPPRRRRAYLLSAGAAVVLVVGLVAGYLVMNRGTQVADSAPAGVAVHSVTGVGDVLVDGDGRALYLFEPDEAGQVTCTGGCADKWPPLVAAAGADPVIGQGVDAAKISTVIAQDGAHVLTYDGWPLYRYKSDQVGEVTGSGKDQNGGVWWALTPSGERVHTR